MNFYRVIFGMFLSIFFIFSVSALDMVIPGSYDGNIIYSYPNNNFEIGFLKNFEGKNFFIDLVNCENLTCSAVETRGPYYIIKLSNLSLGESKLFLTYHFAGEIEPKEYNLKVFNSEENLKILFFMEDSLTIFENKMAKVLIVNNSDIKISGTVYSNYPDEIFKPIYFDLEPKQKKEFETFFYANKPGLQDLVIFYKISEEKQLIKKTIFVNSDVKDFLSLPKYSYFATNPALYLFSSISYILSLLA